MTGRSASAPTRAGLRRATDSADPDAALVILRLVYVVMGDGKRDHRGNLTDRGLMTREHRGEQHVPTCQVGYYVVAGDSQRGGQPCSDRCQRAQEALRVAAEWLYEHRAPERQVAAQTGKWEGQEVAG